MFSCYAFLLCRFLYHEFCHAFFYDEEENDYDDDDDDNDYDDDDNDDGDSDEYDS